MYEVTGIKSIDILRVRAIILRSPGHARARARIRKKLAITERRRTRDELLLFFFKAFLHAFATGVNVETGIDFLECSAAVDILRIYTYTHKPYKYIFNVISVSLKIVT